VNVIPCDASLTDPTTGVCRYNPLVEQEIQPDTEKLNLFGRGTLQVSQSLTAYLEVGLFNNKTKEKMVVDVTGFFACLAALSRGGPCWADTAVATTGEGADTVTVRRVVTYQATGNEGQGARKAVRIATSHTSEVNGSQPTPQGSAKISGTGTGSGSYLVSSDGRYLGGQWEITSALQLSGSFSPQPVPITITQSTKVSILP
jgi:hypothetical protein